MAGGLKILHANISPHPPLLPSLGRPHCCSFPLHNGCFFFLMGLYGLERVNVKVPLRYGD